MERSCLNDLLSLLISIMQVSTETVAVKCETINFHKKEYCQKIECASAFKLYEIHHRFKPKKMFLLFNLSKPSSHWIKQFLCRFILSFVFFIDE